MKIKELHKTVNLTWSPADFHPIMLAAGTAAQQLDSSFSTNATLELYSLNMEGSHQNGASGSTELKPELTVDSADRFHKLIWGDRGVIVGGCEGGVMRLYDAEALLKMRNDGGDKIASGDGGLLAKPNKHTGAVRALDLNPYQTNLLASGASDSEIYIWDLNNTETPMSPGGKSQPAEDVQCVAWNRQVQHILASSFSSRCVVWDLRKNEPIIKLSDGQSRLRWGQVCWHPEIATQLCLASEEDQHPVIQMWDLRYATAPLKVLEKHQRGVLSMSWCRQDPSLLMSCGKDDALYCWNASSELPGGELSCTLPTSAHWNHSVSWCPRSPLLVASASFEGGAAVHCLMGAARDTHQQQQTHSAHHHQSLADSFPGMDPLMIQQHQQQQQQQQAGNNPVAVTSHDPLTAPKWMRRPCGASFGFGGKLVTFGANNNNGNRETATSDPAANQKSAASGRPQIHVSRLVTEPELVERSAMLERALRSRDFPEYCRSRADAGAELPQAERYLWYFLKARFAPTEADVRDEMLDLLGYKPEDMSQKLSKYVNTTLMRPGGDKVQQQQQQQQAVDSLTDQMAGLSRNVDPTAAFDAIASNNVDRQQQQQHEEQRQQRSAASFKINTSDDQEGLITQAILSGNTEAAVELCFEAGRTADAIVIAIAGGSELLARTQYRYLQILEESSSGTSGLCSLITGLVSEDWTSLVEGCDLDAWRAALAAALTHCGDCAGEVRGETTELAALCGILAERLERAGRWDEAALCHICAGDCSGLAKAVLSHGTSSSTGASGADNVDESGKSSHGNGRSLMDAVEIVTVMRAALAAGGERCELSDSVGDLLTRHALTLSSQGSLQAALTHLNDCRRRRPTAAGATADDAGDDDVTELRDRLCCALGLRDPYSTLQQQHGLYGDNNMGYNQQQQQMNPTFGSAATQGNTGGMFPPLPQQQQQQLPNARLLTYAGNTQQHQPAMYNTGLPGQQQTPSAAAAILQPAQPQPLSWQSQFQQPPLAPLVPPPTSVPPTSQQMYQPLQQQQQQQSVSKPPAGILQPPQQQGGYMTPQHAPAPPVAPPPAAAQPPRPLSVGSSHGSALSARSKYVLDPSVQYSTSQPVYNNSQQGYSTMIGGGPLNNQPPLAPPAMYNTYNSTGSAGGVMTQQPQSQQQPLNNASSMLMGPPQSASSNIINNNANTAAGNQPYGNAPLLMNRPATSAASNILNPAAAANIMQNTATPVLLNPAAAANINNNTTMMMDQQQQHMQQQQPVAVARSGLSGPTPPPGWNDPPILTGGSASRRQSTKQQADYNTQQVQQSLNPLQQQHQQQHQQGGATTPITHPIFGTAPIQTQDSTMMNQQFNSNQQQQHFNTGLPNQQQQQQPPLQHVHGGYNNGYGDSTTNQQQQMYSANGMPQNDMQQQQQLQQQQQQQHNLSTGNTTTAVNNQQQQQHVQQPKPKQPLPEEHVYLQVVLDELRDKCAASANNPQLRRKLEDVSRKLEALYDMLRDNRLSTNTLQVLHQMVQMVQIGDYAGGIGLHTTLVAGPDFAQIASFMPGLKVLLLSAIQLQVVLR